jgi:hypothetical protein
MEYREEVKALATVFMGHLLSGTHGHADAKALSVAAYDAAEAFMEETRHRAAPDGGSGKVIVPTTPEIPRLSKDSDSRAEERRRRSIMDQALGPALKRPPPPV